MIRRERRSPDPTGLCRLYPFSMCQPKIPTQPSETTYERPYLLSTVFGDTIAYIWGLSVGLCLVP